jgi:hypothetical protein
MLRFVMEKVDPTKVEAIDRVLAVNVDAWMVEVTTRVFIERVDPWNVEVNIVLDVSVDPVSVENVMNCVWIVETWTVDTNKVESIVRVLIVHASGQVEGIAKPHGTTISRDHDQVEQNVSIAQMRRWDGC